jgi:transcriptional regulator with XRE-family HTH domain
MIVFNEKAVSIKAVGFVKERRMLRDITQKELSERSQVPLATLRKFEQTGQISLQSFFKIIWVLDCLEDVLNALKEEPENFKSMDELLAKKNIKKKQRVRKK